MVLGVIFDYGRVLSRPQPEADVRKLESLSGVEGPRFRELYWSGRKDYDRGRLDCRGFWRAFASAAGREYSGREVEDLVDADSASWGLLNEPMVGWLKTLQGAGVRTALLSNMGLDFKRYAERHFDWFGEFDHKTISCDAGFIKPEPEIYAHCLKGLGLGAGDVLFIDDTPENVEAARALGMLSVLFDGVDSLRERAAGLGLPGLD
jgi:putative hydrolase of the HAD superfamily